MSSYDAITDYQQPTVKTILSGLKEQEQLYESIFNLVKDYIGLDDPKKQENYL
jgi:hypothetical protein